MKKVKGLLLFGILTLLGIGSSFGTFFELNDLTGSQLLIPNYSYRRDGTAYYSTYNYTLGNVSYHSGEFRNLDNSAALNLHICRGSNLNVLGFSNYNWKPGGNLYTIQFGDISNCSSFNELTNFEYVYLSNSIPISPYSTRSTGDINSYIYFDDNYFYTNYGSVRDVPIGYSRQKLFLSFVGNYGIFSTGSDGDYLFTSIGRDSFNIEDLGDGLYNFDLDVYSGILELHYSDYSLPYYSGSRTVILSLGSGVVYFNFYTGYYYGIKEIQDGVLPLYKGYLTYNNSSSEGYTQFINFLNNGHKIVLSNGGTNGISFTSYGYYYFTQTNLGGGYFTTTSNLTLDFEFDDSVPTFIIPGGNGNQSNLNRPSYTTGQVAACRNPSYYGIASLGEGFSNPICDEINSLIYVGEDENGNSIYVYYNDDGSWWVRTMGEANLTSVSAPSGFEIDSSGNVSTIWEVVCTGNFCDDYLSGLKAEDMEQYRYVNIEFGDSIILNTGYYENFFSSLNLTGYVFKCPYTYSNSRFVLGKNIIRKLGGYDPFLPVNCFIAAFENGRRVQFFDDAFGGFNRGPLMDGDTQNHNNLFTFFDILLSIGLIFFLMKFYHLFK